jgi:uncharacterized membrane-anchored protein YhcB (DUF1043 family)
MDANTLIGLITGLIFGLLAGAAGTWLWWRFGASGDGADSKRQAEYQEEVADHFVKTAELVNRLTDSYKEVFDHLRDGAGRLVDEQTLRERLAHEENKDVTLHLIGYRDGGARKGPQEPGSPAGVGKGSGSGDS